MTKQECIISYNQQGYRTLEIPINPDNPKALTRKGWDKEPTELNIGEKNLYAVVQEGTRLVFDIDDIELNDVLEDYLDKTLVVETGNGGRHYYFEDIPRLVKYKIKSTKLYKEDKIVGDIKADMSYVIGCGSSYEEEDRTKTYSKISSVETILKTDCFEILKILQNKGISTKKTGPVKNMQKSSFEDGPQMGERNNECFKTACNLFEKEKMGFEAGLNFVRTWNSQSITPLDDSEIQSIVKSAWNRTNNKKDFGGEDKIDNVVTEIKKDCRFITLRESDEILLYTGKIYDRAQAESIIKEKTETLIPNCKTNYRIEVINKIKAQTYIDIEEFDNDPSVITVENGILNLDSLELAEHTPDHLSRVLLPVEYLSPKYEIKDETIFEDIKTNLKETLFWKFLTSSFTIDGKLKKEEFETALEMASAVFIKKQIDDRAFMNLGKGENGKSVYLEYIESLLGKNNVSRIPLQEIAEDRFMRAELDGKSANIFTDLEQYELKKTGKIKAITSCEGIQVQRKHQHPFEMYPFCKLMFSCNRFPKVYDQTQGFFRRWIIIVWERNFENDPERDEHLKEKLMSNSEEKGLVFSSLIHLARKLNRVGKFTHSKNWKDIQLEWNANADPIDDFVSNYVVDSENNVSVREVYHFYKEVMLEKSETPLTIGKFGKSLSEYFDQDRIQENGKTMRVWLNIALKKPKQIELEDFDR